MSVTAQPPALPPGVYRAGGGVSAPAIVEKQEPQYSEEARVAKLEGTVRLSLIVSADGQTRDLRVLRSLGLGLDEMAIKAVSGWRFKPGLKEGNPVDVMATIEVNFRLLLEARAWHLAGAAFQLPEGASRPILVSAKYPPLSGSEETGAVTLSFDVDETGYPRNVRAAKSSDPKWEAEVTSILLSGWRFDPAGVPVHCTLDFVRGGRPAPATSVPTPSNANATAPTLIYRVEPSYSEEARKAQYMGTVVLSIVVGADGTPRNVHIVRPLGMGLDEKAIEAVQKWRFKPATRGGKPTDVTVTIEVNFRLGTGR